MIAAKLVDELVNGFSECREIETISDVELRVKIPH